MHSHFVSYLGFFSTKEDQIHNGVTLQAAYPILSISCLLIPWRLKGPGHQQAWNCPNKLEYSVSGIRRARELKFWTLPLSAEFLLKLWIGMCVLYHFSTLNGTGSSNDSSWKTRTHIPYSQYNGYWWPDNKRSQVIRSHNIGLSVVCSDLWCTWTNSKTIHARRQDALNRHEMFSRAEIIEFT